MRAFLLFVLLLALTALAWQRGVRVPDRFNPWAPLDVKAAPNLLTRFKLHRLTSHPRLCRTVLRRSGAKFARVPDRSTEHGCGWHDAVRLQTTRRARLQRPALVTCPLAVSLAMMDRHALQPLARSYFGESVVRIDHVGSYACRPIYGRADAPLSRHATAQAIDVTGVVLADGRHITVKRDWDKGRKGAFLHDVEHRACGFFGMILGPGYNAAHRGHFHLQSAGGGWCR